MIWIKRILFIFFLLLVFAATTGIFVNWKYGDDLKEGALEAIRSTIETDVSFNEDVAVSLWQDFPMISVEIQDIYIQDAFETDTLLIAKRAFVQFDLIKIIRSNFTISGIRISDGSLRLRRTEKDKWNYRVWKIDTTSDKRQKVDLSIEILTLENIHLDYDDRMVDLNIQFLSHRSKIKGRFTDDNQRLGMSLNGFMERLTMIGNDRVVSLPLSLAGVLNIRSKERVYTVEMGNAMLADNEMLWDAEWKGKEDGMHIRLKVHADNVTIEDLLPHLWPQMPENIKKLLLKGNSDLTLKMEGPFTKTHGPELDATIRMRNGGLIFRNTQVSELNFKGKLFMQDIKRSKAMRVAFGSFSLKTPQGNVKGSGVLNDLNNPYLKISSTGTSRLEEIIKVTGISEQMKGSGNVAWNIDFAGPLGINFNTTLNEFRQMKWSGDIDLSEAEMKFSSGVPIIKDLTAKVVMSADRTDVKNCSGSIGHIAFDGSIQMPDLKNIIIEENKAVALTGQVHIEELDVTKLPAEWKFESETKTESNNSRTVSLNVKTEVDIIRYNDFTASDVSGNMHLKNNRLTVKDLRFNALDGKANADLSYHPINTGYQLNIDANLINIDMSRALSEWNNFGQTTVTSTNLKGRASAEVNAQLIISSEYEIVMDELWVETDLEISGGELIDFGPLLAMSRFISVDELKHVEFDTLRNHISIKESRLSIPKMSVSSSILNVDVFGEHGFDLEMDYHVNLLLNDILRRRSKKKKTFDGHEIMDSKGKTRLYLWIRGKPDDLKVGFDKKEVRKKVKDDLKKEGQIIKQLFREEFGGEKTATMEEETIQFRLEEQDEPASTQENETEAAEQKPIKKKKRGLFSTEPETEETEGGFEIEFDP